MSDEVIQGEVVTEETALVAAKSFLELIQPRPLPQTPFQLELERSKTKILFSKYPDGTLRLYKPDSLIGDTPAGYNEQKVSVKVRVTSPTEDFMVVLQTTREQLDKPGTEEFLAQNAYRWSRMK